jgi:hypothetical protein
MQNVQLTTASPTFKKALESNSKSKLGSPANYAQFFWVT